MLINYILTACAPNNYQAVISFSYGGDLNFFLKIIVNNGYFHRKRKNKSDSNCNASVYIYF